MWLKADASPNQHATSVAGPDVVTVALVTVAGGWLGSTSFQATSCTAEPRRTSTKKSVISSVLPLELRPLAALIRNWELPAACGAAYAAVPDSGKPAYG